MRVEAAVSTAAPSLNSAGWRLEHTYAQLPKLLHEAVEPTPVAAPRLVILNRSLARTLGLDPEGLATPEGAAVFAGNALPPGARPLAQAYAGHQYGHFTKLGDGRALLLGEQVAPGGARFDLQLKGSGPTPFSRRGDGRAALGPMLREYLISEAMDALRVPTTRSLAVAATGEEVWRQTPAPGAVLTRVAASHIRVGTFEWVAARGDLPALRTLVDYTLARHFPTAAQSETPAATLLERVIEGQAYLIARWMLLGFVHGVMNTDNMAVSGETIDYGPCAFMNAYDPATVFSSIDTQGRYAYGNQPAIAQWNLARFAETLIPLLAPEEARAVEIGSAAIERFGPRFLHHWFHGMRQKLGLFTEEPEDRALIEGFLSWLQRQRADFTNSFAGLVTTLPPDDPRTADAEFQTWHSAWRARLTRQPQSLAESEQLRHQSNPAFIPRNHLVEAALRAAVENDLKPFESLLGVLAEPYHHRRNAPEYQQPGPDSGEPYLTFCGT